RRPLGLAQPLMLTRLLLLHLCQPVGERVGIIRVRGHGGNEEQQRQQGTASSSDYAGGAPAEPGMPGSRRGVKLTSPNGAGAPFGVFSFFFFFTSRLPLSRDFAMVPSSPDLVRRAAIVPSITRSVHATVTVRGVTEQDLEAGDHRLAERTQVVPAFEGPDPP